MIFEKISSFKFSDVSDCNVFQEDVIGSNIWTWCRATLYSFMKLISFVHRGKINHYEHTKTRQDVIAMRDNFLEWIEKYRQEKISIILPG